VSYYLRLHPKQRAAAERAHTVHADSCPIYRTIHGCVDITTSLDLEDIASPGDRA